LPKEPLAKLVFIPIRIQRATYANCRPYHNNQAVGAGFKPAPTRAFFLGGVSTKTMLVLPVPRNCRLTTNWYYVILNEAKDLKVLKMRDSSLRSE
jgi:hypothetical protein